MKNTFLSLVAGIAASLALGVNASTIIGQPEEAYELGLGEVSLPRSESGSVIFKACPECRTQSLRVTSSTVYRVNQDEMPLADLLRTVGDLRSARGGTTGLAVYVFYNRDSKRVTRLVVDTF